VLIGNVVALERPRSIDALLEVLERVEGPRFLLAGGTDLLVKAKDGLLPDGTWIDIWGIEELKRIRDDGRDLELGALVTMSDVCESPLLREVAPPLWEACRIAGAVQIRNRATLGGNAGNASPAGDSIPALYVLGARVVLASKARGQREVPIEQLFKGPGKTVIDRDEAILAFRFARRKGARGTFARLGQRQAQAISKVSIAVHATFDAQKRVGDVKIALGAVAATVVRAPRCESFLVGRALDDEGTLRSVAELVREECTPISDIRSTKEYRREQVGNLLARALRAIRP
jgi:CO/xanthine dehydrogenase FAD-binding subunit